MSIYEYGPKRLGVEKDPLFDNDQVVTSEDMNEVSDRIEAIEESANPTTQTLLINPLLFDKNNDFDVTISVDTTLEVANTGNSIVNAFSMYRFRVEAGITLTFGTSFPAELLADTAFLSSIEADKTNTVVFVWDGEQIRRWSNQVTSFGTPAPTAPTISSFIITDANPDQGQITFNVTPTAGTMTGFTLDGSFSDMTIGAILTQVANVWTVQLSRSAVNAEAGNLIWASSDIANGVSLLADGSISVTNQVGAIASNPVYQSSEIGNVSDSVITFTTDIESDFTWLGTAEIIITASGGAVTVLSAVGDTNVVTGGFNLSRSIAFGEVVTVEVLLANGIGNTLDFSKKMGAVSALTSVTNNVDEGYIDVVFLSTQDSTAVGNDLTSAGSLATSWNAQGIVDGSYKAGQLSDMRGTTTGNVQALFIVPTQAFDSVGNFNLGIFVNGGTGNYSHRVNSPTSVDSGIAWVTGDELGVEISSGSLTYYYIRASVKTNIVTITVTDQEWFGIFALNNVNETISNCLSLNV